MKNSGEIQRRMSNETPSANPSRKRNPLSSGRIASEALKLIDELGLEGFSFRVLARRLGCKPMSIYHYFPSKAHLYEELVNICLSELAPTPETGSWRERLRHVAMETRKTALRHPGFFLYMAIFRMNSRAGLTYLNDIMKLFDETGSDPATRARQFRSLSYYLMGAGLDESLGYARGPSSVDPVPAEEAARDFSSISAAGPYFAPKYHTETFEYGLDLLLDQIEAEAEILSD